MKKPQDPAEEIPQSKKPLDRCEFIYQSAIRCGDTKTALQAQKEINKLLGLYAKAPEESTGPSEDTKKLALISSYILPLNLCEEKYPLEEHCRVAAETISRIKKP